MCSEATAAIGTKMVLIKRPAVNRGRARAAPHCGSHHRDHPRCRPPRVASRVVSPCCRSPVKLAEDSSLRPAMTAVLSRTSARLAWTREVLGDQQLTSAPPRRTPASAATGAPGTRASSWIVMDSPPAQENPQPWLEIGARLADAGLHVPAVRAHDRAARFRADGGSRLTPVPARSCTTTRSDALYADGAGGAAAHADASSTRMTCRL